MLFFLYFTLSVNYHAVQPVVCVISYSLRAITHTTCVHRENSNILIRVQNVFKIEIQKLFNKLNLSFLFSPF